MCLISFIQYRYYYCKPTPLTTIPSVLKNSDYFYQATLRDGGKTSNVELESLPKYLDSWKLINNNWNRIFDHGISFWINCSLL
jgi:hypothetical protein